MKKQESKTSKAKQSQSYVPVNLHKCGTCKHFSCDQESWDGVFGGVYHRDKNLRCGIGGFVVKKQGVCNLWEAKQP